MLTPSHFNHIQESEAAKLPAEAYTDFTDQQRNAIGKINGTIEETFRPLMQYAYQHYMTCGQWSNHELLTWILAQTGPADVNIGVWSISEAGARKLVDLLDSGCIFALNAVLDYRSQNRHPEAHQLAKHAFSNVVTFPMHAKITTIKNDSWSVCLCTSANYTNNPRPEAGCIITVPNVVDFYNSILLNILDHGNPFE